MGGGGGGGGEGREGMMCVSVNGAGDDVMMISVLNESTCFPID